MPRECHVRGASIGFVCLIALGCVTAESARADAFSDYGLVGSFDLPGSYPLFDVLNDGRLVALTAAEVLVEDCIGARTFTSLGELQGADMPDSWSAAFLRVSPDGTRLAVGNGGGASFANFQVGVFSLAGLAGDWFGVNHYDAEWIDDTHLAMSAGVWGQPSVVTALDTTSNPGSPANPTLIENVNGSSAGVTFDANGNLYTGNGYAGGGPSETGWIKAFSSDSWMPALSGGAAVDFEAGGVLVADLLSAGSLGFDTDGNLHVGGGDFLGGSEQDNAALVRGSVVVGALGGGGPADPNDLAEVRRFDPDVSSSGNFYDVNCNAVTGELYLRDGATVWSYAVPEPASFVLLAAGLMIVTRRTRLGSRVV